MRITNAMMVNQFLTDSNSALNRVSKYQSQVDSTKRINGIADDPQSTLLALRARDKLSNLALYKANISTASSYLNETESVTSELNEILKSVYGDIVTAQSGGKGADDQKTIAEELKNLQKEVLSIANTTMGTSYLFGGYNYTGSIVGSSKNPPFTVNETTGDLMYNGINLSQVSWKADFDANTALMTANANTAFGIADTFSTSYNGEFAKSQASQILNALNGLMSNAAQAMKDVEKYDVDGTVQAGTQYQAFKEFYDKLSPVVDQLNTEVSKELAGEYILDTDPAIQKTPDGAIDYEYYADQGISVYTADELANKFDKQKVYDIINTVDPAATPPRNDTVRSLLEGGAGSPLNTAISDLSAAMPTPSLAGEQGNTTRLQIGVGDAQTIDITMTGLDLLGTGSDNIYHLLGRAIDILESGEAQEHPDQLSSMITSIQNAMGNVRTLETSIGASQNRLTLISSRYDTNGLNYTKMRSDAEDADMAEAIMNLSTAQTIYNAALAGGSEILKTSLIDFLR